MRRTNYAAIVIGAGPNGLAAAITLARAGRSVLLVEARQTVGGGTRTAELTLPGFRHDVCSAIHTVGAASPFFRGLPLEQYGLEWIFPPVEAAHPLDGGKAVLLHRSVEQTAQGLGADGPAYRRIFAPLVKNQAKIARDLLGPLPLPPRHPLALAQFGMYAIRSATGLANQYFKSPAARALFGGFSAHSIQPLEAWSTAGVGVTLQLFAHGIGMPLARGGSQSIADALLGYYRSLGGEVITGCLVERIEDLPPADAYLFDTTPRQLVQICAERLPARYLKALQRYRYGPGVFKLDYALDGPVPWQAAECQQAATVHVGGGLEEIAQAEREVWQGIHPQKPFLLITQTSLFDPSRAPDGKHTLWAYCHAPSGSDFDMTERIEAQIERFAPGFRNRILARHSYNSRQMEAYNPNYIGGDIIGGVQDLRQLYFRPTVSANPYRTPAPGIYLCSSSTPPGGAVHGMCGYFAARTVINDRYG
jgi:phytoene dehydrogenase-like protein